MSSTLSAPLLDSSRENPPWTLACLPFFPTFALFSSNVTVALALAGLLAADLVGTLRTHVYAWLMQ